MSCDLADCLVGLGRRLEAAMKGWAPFLCLWSQVQLNGRLGSSQTSMGF